MSMSRLRDHPEHRWMWVILIVLAIAAVIVETKAQTLSSIDCAPAALTSGQSSTCTVTLTGVAPSGGQAVNLTSSSTAFAMPGNVTIPSGSISASFTATANTVATQTSVNVSAQLPGVGTVVIVSPIPSPPAAYTLSFSTYFGGGAADWIRDVATDAQGNIYVTGGTMSNNFPVTAGAYDLTLNGLTDVFMAKFTPTGSLVCSTYLGGPNYDRAYAIEVDASGVYLAGRAGQNFPTTPGSPQPIFAGDNQPASTYGAQDGFITKMSLDCTQVLWSTYIGDTGPGFFRDLTLDGQGGVYAGMSGVTGSVALVASGVYDTTPNGSVNAVMVKLATGGAFQWATYFGGSGASGYNPSVRADASGVYMLSGTNSTTVPTTMGPPFAGVWDMHLAKFSPDGTQLLLGRYIGGAGNEYCETHCLALDGSGNLFAAFTSGSTTLGTVGAYDDTYNGSCTASCGNYSLDGLVVKLNPAGTILVATYFGGSNGDGVEGVETDAAGNVYISGGTYSTNLPMAGGSYQTTNKGQGDFFVAKFSGDLTQLLYSSYIGGGAADYSRSLHADSVGNIYVGGEARGGFPTVNAFQPVSANGASQEGVLVKFAP